MSEGVERSTIAILLLLILLAGCETQIDGAENDESYQGKIILFDFYDADVRLAIGADVVFEGQLNVLPENESTGLSRAHEIKMDGCKEIVVTSGGRRLSSETICPTKDGFEIYINPHIDPKIKITYDPAFGLD